MSNEYALFTIVLPNDFDVENGNASLTIQTVALTSSSGSSSNTVPSEISVISEPISAISIIGKEAERFQQQGKKSLCIALTNYFAERRNIQPIWMISENRKTYQVTFYVEFGFVSDNTLDEIIKLGIGKRHDTKIFVLPTTVILGGDSSENDEMTIPLAITDGTINNEGIPKALENNLHDTTPNDLKFPDKIRKRINQSNFRKSVRARLMVHQVVASIRASTTLSFDFVILLCLASLLAAFGLLENSAVIIVASMLVSPLMNPIIGIVFGLSVREHSLWKRGVRNEIIGLVICVTCGFIIGLFTTFSETTWGSSSSFPTAEMRSRGDIKRLWVGVLIALPSGAGVAISVLGGNTGSLVGVAISASLLPPAVNCGLLFAYAILAAGFSSIGAVRSPSANNTLVQYNSQLLCAQYINNNYQPLYRCSLAAETAILGSCSLLLTIVNIICVVLMGLIIFRIKEVVPLHQPNKDITEFFHHDVKVARDYNKTMHAADFESMNAQQLTANQTRLAQTIVNHWKTFKSPKLPNNPQNRDPTTISSINNNDNELNNAENHDNNNTLNIDKTIHRKLFRIKAFAKEYDLDVYDRRDYDLLNSTSREKVLLLVNDLIDMCQEAQPVFVNLFNLHPFSTQTSASNEHLSFYQEIIELLPPKWYQLFIQEQRRRNIRSWSSSFERTASLRLPQFTKMEKSKSLFPRIDENDEGHSGIESMQRRGSVPVRPHHRLADLNQDDDIPVKGTRFRLSKPPTTIQIDED